MSRDDVGMRIVPRPHRGIGDGDTVCVSDPSRPLPPPADGTPLESHVPRCGWCGRRHLVKTYRLHLHAGSTIVSATVWDRLQALDDNPFEFVNLVADAPGQNIGLSAGSGVRHDGIVLELRNPQPGMPAEVVVCLMDHTRPLPPPADGSPLADHLEPCKVCGQVHLAKTYQVPLVDGQAVVSLDVWLQLQRIPEQPFIMVGIERDPPRLDVLPAVRPELVERYAMPLRSDSN